MGEMGGAGVGSGWWWGEWVLEVVWEVGGGLVVGGVDEGASGWS